MITKKHFIAMAKIVDNIRQENWGSVESEQWARDYINSRKTPDDSDIALVACQVAEAFIALAYSDNPGFNIKRFLVACGLMPNPKTPTRLTRLPISKGDRL